MPATALDTRSAPVLIGLQEAIALPVSHPPPAVVARDAIGAESLEGR